MSMEHMLTFLALAIFCQPPHVLVAESQIGRPDTDSVKFASSMLGVDDRDLYDAVARGTGFERVVTVGDIASGDVIVIKPNKGSQIAMIVAGQPIPQVTEEGVGWQKPETPWVFGTNQWAVLVVDAAPYGHSGDDIRVDGGVGIGFFRLYSTAAGDIEGYTWSFASEHYMSQRARRIIVGRPRR